MGMMDGDSEARIRALEDEVRELRKQVSRIPVRNAVGGGGGGGFSIKQYTDFPEIPEVPTIISCKLQLWYAESGYTYWKPAVEFTSETGEPGT